MQNDKKSMSANGIINPCPKDLLSISSFIATVLLIFTQLPTAAIAQKTEQKPLQQFFAFEIAGISLRTSFDAIPSILESHGYTQTGSATYTKQIQVPGQRKSIYRIEVDDGPTQRQIIYFRGQSGGRVKSSALRAKPIQVDEIDMANTLHQLVCSEIIPQIQKTRACQPATDTFIIFGNGKFVEIGKKVSAQLNASADSTTIGIKYIKE